MLQSNPVIQSASLPAVTVRPASGVTISYRISPTPPAGSIIMPSLTSRLMDGEGSSLQATSPEKAPTIVAIRRQFRMDKVIFFISESCFWLDI